MRQCPPSAPLSTVNTKPGHKPRTPACRVYPPLTRRLRHEERDLPCARSRRGGRAGAPAQRERPPADPRIANTSTLRPEPTSHRALAQRFGQRFGRRKRSTRDPNGRPARPIWRTALGVQLEQGKFKLSGVTYGTSTYFGNTSKYSEEQNSEWWAGTGLNRRHQDFQTHPHPPARTHDRFWYPL